MIFSIVIPAYNEEAAVESILGRCLKAARSLKEKAGALEVEVILVDDGSRDATAAKAAAVGGVRVLRHEKNRGYGAALKTGFAAARGEWLGFLDADGTCDPEFFVDLLELARREGLDIALGSRLHPASRMPAVRRLGNWLFKSVVNLIGGTRVGDVASGMRVLSRRALARLYPLPDGMHLTPAMSVRALLDPGLAIGELPMPYEERIGRSKLSVLGDGLRFLRVILETAMTYRPFTFFAWAAASLAALGSAFLIFRLGGEAAPLAYYLRNRRVEEWMLYRFVLVSVLFSSALFLGALGLAAQSLVGLINREAAPPKLPRAARWAWEHLPWLGLLSLALAAFLNRRPLASYFATGSIPPAFWVFPVAGAIFALVGIQCLAFSVMARLSGLLWEREPFRQTEAGMPPSKESVPAAPRPVRRVPLVAWAFLAACALCLQYPLMALYRSTYSSKYADMTRTWRNDGSFAVIGFWAMETGDEAHYAARTQTAARRVLPEDPYSKEGRRAPRLVSMDFLTYFIFGRVAAVLGDINLAWILLRFICVFAWFLLVYAMAREATGRPSLSLACAAFIAFFSYWLTFAFLTQIRPEWSARGLLKALWVMASYSRTEGVLRLPRPGFSYAMLYAASLAIVAAAKRRSLPWALGSGLLGGALAYVRMDVWSTYLAAAGLFLALTSLRERVLSRPLAVSFLVSFLASLPWMRLHFPIDPESLECLGTQWGRVFDASSLPYFALAFLAWIAGRSNPMVLWFGCVAGGIGAALNVQFVLGYTSGDLFHWKFFGNIYAFLLLAALSGPVLVRLRPRWRWGTAARLGAALMLLIASLQAAVYAGLRYPYQAIPRDMEDAYRWLRQNTPEDSVVAALSSEATTLMPVYSHNKTLLGYPNPIISGIGFRENARRLASMLALLGGDMERFIKECADPVPFAEERPLDRPALERHRWYGLYLFYYPMSKTPGLLRESWRGASATEFPFDYVWFGHFERDFASPRFPASSPVPLERAYANPSVTIYRVAPKGRPS